MYGIWTTELITMKYNLTTIPDWAGNELRYNRQLWDQLMMTYIWINDTLRKKTTTIMMTIGDGLDVQTDNSCALFRLITRPRERKIT